MTKFQYILQFIGNSIITYFAAMMYLWSGHTKTVYWSWLIAVVISQVIFTFFPRKYSPLITFIVKILLHGITTYLLMVIFGKF